MPDGINERNEMFDEYEEDNYRDYLLGFDEDAAVAYVEMRKHKRLADEYGREARPS